jgi:hypothetical protein
MTIPRIDSIWDYVGDALQRGHGNFMGARDDRLQRDEREAIRKQQEDLALLNMLAQGVQSGTVFSNEANSNPIAQNRGMVFRPSQQERATRIADMPMGAPDMRGMVAPGAPLVMPKPWSDDQRRLAGMPTADQMAVERTAGKKATIEGQVTGFEQYQAPIQSAAERYVADAINSGVNVEKFPQLIATTAYNTWMEEQKASGDMGVDDPGLQTWARSHFAKAVQDVIQRQVELRALTTRAANSGGGADQTVQWARLLQARKEALFKNIDWAESLTEETAKTFTTPGSPSYMPEVANALMEKYRLEQALNEISGTMPGGQLNLSPESQAYIQSLAPSAGTGGGGTPNQGGSGAMGTPMSPEDISRAVQVGKQIPQAQRQAWFDSKKATLTPQDKATIASRLGVSP